MTSAPVSTAFTLRLVRPDEAGPDKQPGPSREERLRARRLTRRRWTLRELYEQHVRPHVLDPQGLARDSYELYGLAVKLWEDYTANPPIAKITAQTGRDWLERLTERRWHGQPLAAETIRTRARYVQQILDAAGPDRAKGRRVLPGAQAISRKRIPYLVPKAIEETAAEPFTADEVWAWVQWIERHVRPSRATRPVDSTAWWRAFVAVMYYTGLRPGSMLNLEWAWVQGEWLVIPARAIKGRKHGLRVHLVPAAREALDAIRLPKRERIFPWCRGEKSKRYLFNQIEAQQRAAGIRPFGCRGLRRLFSTTVSAKNPLVAAWMLGHSPPREVRVLARHYANRDAVIREVMATYPRLGPATQRTLFVP